MSIKKSTLLNPMMLLLITMLALFSVESYAATTGNQFAAFYTEILGWIQGYLGKIIAIVAFILGAASGLARQNPIPALVGFVFALLMLFVPNAIDGLLTATI